MTADRRDDPSALPDGWDQPPSDSYNQVLDLLEKLTDFEVGALTGALVAVWVEGGKVGVTLADAYGSPDIACGRLVIIDGWPSGWSCKRPRGHDGRHSA